MLIELVLMRSCFQEVQRIRREHLDDSCSVVNDRVKGSLKVTRAFGAGFLKQVYKSFELLLCCSAKLKIKMHFLTDIVTVV